MGGCEKTEKLLDTRYLKIESKPECYEVSIVKGGEKP